MCTNGVNTSQLQSTIDMIDEAVAMIRRWTHKSYHLADDAQMERTAEHLKRAQSMMDDLRAELDETRDALEKDDNALSNVDVKLV